MNVRTRLSLPGDLLRSIDELAGPRGRSRYVAEAMARHVRRDSQREAFERTFGAISADDYPHWATRESVTDWIRVRRTERTDPMVRV